MGINILMDESFEVPIGYLDSSVINSWKKLVGDRERLCPWPGPRPLEKGDCLVGREKEKRHFLETLNKFDLIVFHGETGVGKTSLLNNGLKPTMGIYNFKPFIVDAWGIDEVAWSESKDYRFEEHVKNVFLRSIDDDSKKNDIKGRINYFVENGSDTPFIEAAIAMAASDHGNNGESKPVIILDQFEEFLRIAEISHINEFQRWLYRANRVKGIKVVISFRSEYLYKISDCYSRLRPFSFETIQLKPIMNTSAIREIINKPVEKFNEKGDGFSVEISDDLVDVLVCQYGDKAQGSSDWLLSMQSMLFALYQRAFKDSKGGVSLGLRDLEKLLQIRLGNGREESEVALNRLGYREFVARGYGSAINCKLANCKQALLDLEISTDDFGRWFLPIDIFEITVKEHLRRIEPRLSKEGYKEWIGLYELFSHEYSVEIRRLRRFNLQNYSSSDANSNSIDDFMKAIFKAIWQRAVCGQDFFSKRQDIVEGALSTMGDSASKFVDLDVNSGAHSVYGLDFVPWVEDPNEVSSGPMLGCHPIAVYVELAREFIFAILWLREIKICKVYGESNPVIRLIHDGFGQALKEWCELSTKESGDLAVDSTSILSMVSEYRDWKHIGGDHHCWLMNLRWTSCSINGAVIENVTFVNCDFRSTIFYNCTFKGVVFVNCLLDAAIFDRCRMREGIDSLGLATVANIFEGKETYLGMPTFKAEVPDKDIRSLRYFRECSDVGDSEIISITSGVAAVPISCIRKYDCEWKDPKKAPYVASAGEIPTPEGGLLIMGGRVSSLMFRGCFQKDDSNSDRNCHSIVLAYAAGTNLDFVEQEEDISVAVIGGAIRGLTVTRSVGQDTTQQSCADSIGLNLYVENSFVIDTWLGCGLDGSAKFKTSSIVSFMSQSDGLKVDFCADEDCEESDRRSFHSLIFSHTDGAGYAISGIEDVLSPEELIKDLLIAAGRIDYRTNPAKRALEDFDKWLNEELVVGEG